MCAHVHELGYRWGGAVEEGEGKQRQKERGEKGRAEVRRDPERESLRGEMMKGREGERAG